MKAKHVNLILLFLTGFTAANMAFAGQLPDPSADSLFLYNHPFTLRISYSFDAFNKNSKENTYTPANISYYLPDSTFIEKSVKIRPRGHERRDMCQHPPLKIDFSDSLYGINLFDKWKKMKLVSLCMPAKSWEQYIIKEYLIYQAYKILTDTSFNTYLVNVTFEDTDSDKNYEGPGFFIEDIDHVAKRLNGKEIETQGLRNTALDTSTFDMMALFQYMIGNTDWGLPNLHNLKLIDIDDSTKTKPIAVPYDFDYCGLVNAIYAVPQEGFPIMSIRERYFMGICRTSKYYMPLVKRFLDKKDEIYSLFTNCNNLNDYTKKDAINYLDNFYKIIENTKFVGKYIYGNCN